jgi:hypothetical protein
MESTSSSARRRGRATRSSALPTLSMTTPTAARAVEARIPPEARSVCRQRGTRRRPARGQAQPRDFWLGCPRDDEGGPRPAGVTGLADRQRQGRGARFPALAAAVVVREHAAAPDNQRLRGCDSDDACFALVKEASGAPGRLQSSLAPGEPPRGTAAFTGSSSAPVHRPQTSAPLSCMDRRSQPVAAACAPIQERQKLPIVRRRRLDLVQLGCLGIPLSKCCSLPESESMSSRGDLYMRCR